MPDRPDLAAIRARCAGAIGGPWVVPGYDQAKSWRHKIMRLDMEIAIDLTVQVVPVTVGDVPTAEFVAAARTDVPQLLAYIEYLEDIVRDDAAM